MCLFRSFQLHRTPFPRIGNFYLFRKGWSLSMRIYQTRSLSSPATFPAIIRLVSGHSFRVVPAPLGKRRTGMPVPLLSEIACNGHIERIDFKPLMLDIGFELRQVLLDDFFYQGKLG